MDISMINSKQRAALRSMANTLEATLQVGKSGVSAELTDELDKALEARELVKLSVLETAPQSAREAIGMICERLHAQPVQCIGRKITVYRRSRENPRIEL